MSRIIIVLHVVLLFAYRDELISLWAVLPYFCGMFAGKMLDDFVEDCMVLWRKARNRPGT